MHRSEIGALWLGGERCRFRVWAPRRRRVDVHLVAPGERVVPLAASAGGYFEAEVDGVAPGARYLLRLDGELERPDPASRLQPEGVHAPSEVVNPIFTWQTPFWSGRALEETVLYEIHVGSFTEEGTFDAVIPHLDDLLELGVTAIELMPVAQFPGTRNWGYDGVYPYAVQASYGGPRGLKRLVDACHARGLALHLDVVYNHLGPEGNYLREFGPYFTDRHRTPWGEALNFDGPASDQVRDYFIGSALRFVDEFRVDGLRLDAVHAIIDTTPVTFVEELCAAVQRHGRRIGRQVHVIAESSDNDARLIRPRAAGGVGCDAQWNDDFHHALHVALTGEREGYYTDFSGLPDLAAAFRQGYVYTGQHAPSFARRRGSDSAGLPGTAFVVFSQNHDQIGNRGLGERLAALLPPEALPVAAALVILSPFVPLLFMGEEHGERRPFLYFVDHSDPDLVDAVRRGRREEFAGFSWSEKVPDPEDPETLSASRLDRGAGEPSLRALYRELLRLRREMPALACLRPDHCEPIAWERQRALTVRRWSGDDQVLVAASLSAQPCELRVPVPAGRWRTLLAIPDPASSDAALGERETARPSGGDGHAGARGTDSTDAGDGVTGELILTLLPWSVRVLRRDPGR